MPFGDKWGNTNESTVPGRGEIPTWGSVLMEFTFTTSSTHFNPCCCQDYSWGARHSMSREH